MRNTVGILLAAGNSERMGLTPQKPSVSGDPVNKMFMRIGGSSVLERSLTAFENAGCFNSIIIVCREGDIEETDTIAGNILGIPYKIVKGGSERQYSVENALKAAGGADVVAVHDGARCFIDPNVIRECVETAYKTGAAAAGVRSKDTIKTLDNGTITGTLDRNNLANIQTPQAFRYDILMEAHKKAKEDGFLGTDECILLERLGLPVSFIEAHYDNIKITTQEDLVHGKLIAGHQTRTGIGYDAHRLREGLPLILGDVTIPHTKGLSGHSDADVLLHAVIDALLGAAAAGDIGSHFPCTKEFRGISSIELLTRTKKIISDKDYDIVNIDATVVMEKPKLTPYIDEMIANIAKTLDIEMDSVSVKAKTTEGMGFEGEEQGISAMAVATLVR